MSLIRVYDKNETTFTHNGLGVLSGVIAAQISHELNGEYELTVEHTYDDRGKWENLIEDNILKADGQLFRIYRKEKTITSVKVYARHIFYDLLDNLVEYETVSANGQGVISWLLSHAADTTTAAKYSASGDGTATGSFIFDKINIVEAILGRDGVMETLGGELERDNFNIHYHTSIGSDRDVLISYGKNIVGIKETLDTDSICTRLLPIGKDGLTLTPKYVDSDYIANFPHPKIRIREFKDIDNATDLNAAAENYFATSKCDVPLANYKINFIELTKTEQYKSYSVLETVALGDTVTVRHTVLGVDLECKVVRVVKNLITDRLEKIELGNTLGYFGGGVASTIRQVEVRARDFNAEYLAAIASATDLITGNTGGYIKITCDTETGEPQEILIMDTDDIATAQNIWRWNVSGLGFSSDGGQNYDTAITSEGSILADFITTGTLTAALIKAGVLMSVNESTWIDMTDGTFSFADGKVSFDGSTFTINMQDQVGVNNLIWNSSAEMTYEAPVTFVYRKIPRGSNFDYRWTKISAPAGNFNKSSPYTLKTFFSKPANYTIWDFWKIRSDYVPSGRAVGDIMYCGTTHDTYRDADWEYDEGDEDAKFLINDTYGDAPKIDVLAETDDFMIAYYSSSAPSGHTEYDNRANDATLNELVGDLWWDSDASPSTVDLLTSWIGTTGTSQDASGGFVEGAAFKITAGSLDEYFYSQERGKILPSKPYTFQGLIKTAITSGTGAQFIVQEFDSSGVLLTEHSTTLQATNDPTTWSAYSMTFTTDADAASFVVKMIVKAGAGYALFDNLKLEEGINATPWKPHVSELKTGMFEVTDKYARFVTADGSYTMFDPANNGITWHKAGSNKNYHYLVTIGKCTTSGDGVNPVWVQLPDEFKGKEFSVAVALKDLNGYTGGTECIVTASAWVDDDEGINYKQAKVPIQGSCVGQDVLDANAGDFGYRPVDVTYIAIY